MGVCPAMHFFTFQGTGLRLLVGGGPQVFKAYF